MAKDTLQTGILIISTELGLGFSSPTKWCPTLSNQFDIIETIFNTVYYLIFPHQYSEILYTLRFNWIIPYFELESLFQDKNILYYSTL